jgi:hypothetical protein
MAFHFQVGLKLRSELGLMGHQENHNGLRYGHSFLLGLSCRIWFSSAGSVIPFLRIIIGTVTTP